MLDYMVIEILNGREILVNWSKPEKSNFSVSHGTKSHWDFYWIWILEYLAVQIQIEIFVQFEFAVDWNLPTIQDFDYHVIQHFESHLPRNGLWHIWIKFITNVWTQNFKTHSWFKCMILNTYMNKIHVTHICKYGESVAWHGESVASHTCTSHVTHVGKFITYVLWILMNTCQTYVLWIFMNTRQHLKIQNTYVNHGWGNSQHICKNSYNTCFMNFYEYLSIRIWRPVSGRNHGWGAMEVKCRFCSR